MKRSSRQVAARWLPLCLVIACQGETTTPTATPTFAPAFGEAAVTDNVVSTVAVVPDSQMVFAGDQFQIIAQPKNAAGEALAKTIKWTITNTNVISAVGSAQPTMKFKAKKVGTTTIKATADAKFKSSKVVVRGVANAKVVLTPSEATLEPGATLQFVAGGVTKNGEAAGVNVTWTATGGAISPGGVLVAGNVPGTYSVIAKATFGAADTAVVTIGAASDPVAELILLPEAASIAAGGTVQFEVYGRTGAGDSVGITASYAATGGTIAGNGLYTAGLAAGTYEVVAGTAGVADTAEVIIAAPAIDHIVLLPDIAASRPGETTRFSATVWNTVGVTVSDPVTYETTCGTVTAAGVFSAPQGESGSCFVTASVEGVSATTEVVLLANTPGQGIPFGLYDLWASPTTLKSTGVAPMTGSHEYFAPGTLVGHIQSARARGVRLVLAMTGGSHDRYKTNGMFDPAKWEATMNSFNTQAIRDAVAEGVADGTIIGNSVMDEPQQSGTDTKAWGPPGTMTKARVDGLCGYVKAIFPTLPVGVGHDHAVFEPGNSYVVCEFLMAQYAARKGNVTAWRDAGLALAARDGMSIVFSLNLLNGGPQDKTGAWDCAGTGGLGDRSPNCQMSPTQVRDWGKVLGPSGCALLSWMYDGTFMAKPANQAAMSDVAITLSRLPRTPCTRAVL